jgi:hypothetical protein
MKTTALLLFTTLIVSFQQIAVSAEVPIQLKCGANNVQEFHAAGYLVGNPKANLKGSAKNRDESTPRRILTITNPEPNQQSTYEKAFDFENYRYIRNKESDLGWDVYRRDSSKSNWVKLTPTPRQILVYKDQHLYVKIHSKAQLTVLRVSGDSNEAKDFYIYTTTDKVTIKGSEPTSNSAVYTFGHCNKLEKIRNSSVPAIQITPPARR